MDRRALNKQFLQQFPIEHLGDMTLEEYTNLNREDSFCYWLEVKTQELGSIWGGSSYKFGIYRYEKKPDNPSVIVSDEEYAWYKKYAALDRTKAFKVVLNAIVNIAESASKGNFENIEEDDTFGTVVKWKIAFLYANETLLPFYKRDMLETLASKFGHSNPSKAKIYELHRFLMTQKGNKDLYDFCDELVKIEEQSNNKKYWLYAPGENASKWTRCQEQGIMCIGWDELDDLSKLESVEDARVKLREAYDKPEATFMNDGLAVWEFAKEIQIGDIVYAKSGLTKIIGRGVVKSDFIYDPSQEDYIHIRKVEWTHVGEWDVEKLVLKTLTDISENKYPGYAKSFEDMIVNGKSIIKENTQYDDRYLYYINLLLKNKNLILNGAPGTGKTYLAKQIAAHIIFDGNVPENFEEHPKLIEQCGFVQFHPSYDYTDFVEGLRPTRPNQDGNIGFERKDGVFKMFCAKAVALKKYYFKINEQDTKEIRDSIFDEFTYLYFSLLDDIYHKKITEMVSDTGKRYKLDVGNTENIQIYYKEGKSPKSINQRNLQILFVYLIRNNIYSIPNNWTSTDYFKIISDASETSASTIDYKLYEWALKKLLSKYRENHNIKVLEQEVIRSCKDKNKPYIFIIDEINRGEISKIFGELFFSVDPGYRGVKGKVQTQYQNLITEDDPFKEGFYIPENVYIIGTMNDIDRSVECMDFAMRRRFTFKEITAEESAKNMELGTDATERMMSLNNAISEIDGFNSSFHIGAAYFKGVDDFDALWELKLAGLLKEYLRGMPDAEESLEALKKAYYLSNE